MKKKLKDETKWFPSAILYKSDIDEILSLFNGSCEVVKLSDNEFEYDSLTEVEIKRGQRIKNLTITGDTPTMTFTIGSTMSLMRGGSDIILGPYIQIQEILKSRRRPVLHALFNPYTALSISAAIILLIMLFGKAWPPLLAFPIAIVIAGIVIGMFKHIAGGFTQIVLLHPHQELSFFRRNKDAIILSLISSILSAGLGFLIAYLLFRGGIK